MPTAKSKIKYIAFYSDKELAKDENRSINLAVTNKVNYVCSVLGRNGYDVEIVSPCWSESKSGFYKGKVYDMPGGARLRMFASFGGMGRAAKKAKQLFAALQLLLYLLLRTKKHEKILVYHSLALMIPIGIARAVKRLKVVLEVEEIYTTVWKNESGINKEMKYISKADGYIAVSDVLKGMLPQKPCVVLYGSYNVIDKPAKKKTSDEVKVVYAGSVDALKGGALNAVISAEYLPDNFFVHILGFGSTQAIEKLEQQIKSVNEKRKKTCCQYHGTLTGDALRDFLHSCEIGVNPQYEGDYMNTAFPSKILSYLTHSLKVVSTEIKSVKLSKVSPFITFAVSDGPKDIAQAIIKAASGDAADCENAVKELDADFAKDIKALIENL